MSSSNFLKIFESGVCVSECPAKETTELDCKTTSIVADCNEEKIIENIYRTKKLLKYCIPASVDELSDSFKEGWKVAFHTLKSSPVGRYYDEVAENARSVKICIVLGIVYSFIYIYLMKSIAEILAWASIVLT